VRKWRVPSPPKFPPRTLSGFRRRLLAWFRANQRDLPWRRRRDPYRIWLSEVMLQQTRVAAVLPYYQRFLRRFPTVRALARAPLNDVLKYWAGLGYYSRARNLHAAAKRIVARHGGLFPRDYRAALELPGVGGYTAAAILSISHGEPLAVLDGNVARVLARLGAVRGDLRATRRWRRLRQIAQELLAAEAPGEWNQAMMELGATVCTPRAPRCKACPVSRWCRAYALGVVNQLPAKRAKHAPVRVSIAAAVLLDSRERTLLVKQPGRHDGALFSRMWQFPAVDVKAEPAEELAQHLQESLGLRKESLRALPGASHSVTYRHVTLLPFLARVARLPKKLGARTIRLATIHAIPTSSATRKIAAAALKHARS
jgi:A/G-specific adenine glycosylase